MRKVCTAGRRGFLPAGFYVFGKMSKTAFFCWKNVKNKEKVFVKMSDMRYSIGEEVQRYVGKKD